ncbi:hypothetical protein ACIP1X_16520 [Pseudomonas sp. NPDC088885]|uniref:hypothetical protein n=1 Tax=Pseudomonas sp. NPDC088885 TaxID=3364457 RepID=UPI00382B9C59
MIFSSSARRKRISTHTDQTAGEKHFSKQPKPPSSPPLAANVADVAAITLTHDCADIIRERAGIFNTSKFSGEHLSVISVGYKE